jgi:hypothetical protein
MRRVAFSLSLMCIGIAGTVSVGICVALERRQELQEKELAAAHQKTVAARKEQFELQDVKRQIDARDEAVRRRQRYDDEYVAALGGPVGAALKHPDLTILGMLHELARACSPLGSAPHVTVDRFTEFTVLIELPRKETNAVLAEIAHHLLLHSSQYVNTVRFSHRGTVLAQLDRRAIESIADWTKASAGSVEELLLNPEFSEPPTFVGAVPPVEQPGPEPQNLPPEVQRQKMAEERFVEAYRRADAQLRAAFEQQMAAINLAGVKLVSDLDERRKLLAEAERAAAEAKRVLANPVIEYERTLQQQQLDPVYIRAAVRTAAQTYGNSRGAVAAMFAALDERSTCAGQFLTTMKGHFGAWTYQPFQDQIEFHDPTAERDYAAAIKRFNAASEALNQAIDRWIRTPEQTAPPAKKNTRQPGE